MYIQLEYLHCIAFASSQKNNATHTLNALIFLAFFHSFIDCKPYANPEPNPNLNHQGNENERSKRFTNAKKKKQNNARSKPFFSTLFYAEKINENFETDIPTSDMNSWTSGILSIRSV